MDKEKWKILNPILRNALNLEADQRQKYLDSLSIEKEIREEIESLLGLEETAETWSPTTALDLLKDSFTYAKPEDHYIGLKLGVYEVSEEIGFGGMGTVYLAERIDKKFSQKVAVKILRREFNTKTIRQRFRQEREIQAALIHPNIATLIDAGTTEDGVPYLVMEYVEGIRIDKFCLENKLKLNERLKLFNKVCEAVSFAHRNLIIHRDIKPSNIIVTKKVEPKLLDFGISKLIDDNNENTKTITQLGAMTPEYASPEQIKGESVTTATDIYSLGVILFKILTGVMPYDAENKTNSKMLREITGSKPKTPSEAVLDNQQSAIVKSKLKGDLDNIILKSLRKEPERRYQTVEQLADDIWRFIDGLPVNARPATFSYKASKFYKRNKIQVLAGVLVLLSLITGIALAIWQANVAREQARIASEAKQKAEFESAKSKAEEERAKKITKFMEKIISYANPGNYAEGYESSGEAKVIDVLNEMSSKIESEFPDQPDIQSELHHKFTEVYTIRNLTKQSKNVKEKARYHAGRALSLRKQFYGEKHELVAKDMYYLWATNPDSSQEQAKLLAKAIKMMRETNPENINLPYMLVNYANRLWTKNKEDSGEIYYQNAIPKPVVVKLALAENYYIEANAHFRTAYSENHPTIVTCKCYLSKVQIELEKFNEAQKNFPFCRQYEKFVKPKDLAFIASNDGYAERLEKGLQK